MAKRALALLEEQAAGYPSLEIPVSLRIQLEDQRQKVRDLEAQAGISAPTAGDAGGVAAAHIVQKAGAGSTQIGQARDVNINTGPVYNIQGGIHAGQNVVMGDQINYTYNLGDVRNRPEFVSQIHNLQARLAALRVTESLDDADEQVLRSIETRLESAAQEAQKPKPDSQQITTTLQKAKKTLDTLGESITSAVGLGTTLAGLIDLVSKLFGR
jgi:hypothetical protein